MTNERHRNNPLHGVGAKAMLEELVEHYGWDILAEQLKVNSFAKFPSINSAHKFLHKTQWAREKTEAFYLYKFKQLPIPSDEEHVFPPRERSFDADLEPQLPAIITAGDHEFFDDPISGPKFRTPYDKSLDKAGPSRRSDLFQRPAKNVADKSEKPPTPKEEGASSVKKKPSAINDKEPSANEENQSTEDSGSADPWGKWRK